MDEKVKRRKFKKARKRVDELLDLTIADYHRSTAVGLITVLLNVVEDPDDSDRVQKVREQKRDFSLLFHRKKMELTDAKNLDVPRLTRTINCKQTTHQLSITNSMEKAEKIKTSIKDLKDCLHNLHCLVEGEHNMAFEFIESIVAVTESPTAENIERVRDNATEFFTVYQTDDKAKRSRHRRSGSITITGNANTGNIVNTSRRH